MMNRVSVRCGRYRRGLFPLAVIFLMTSLPSHVSGHTEKQGESSVSALSERVPLWLRYQNAETGIWPAQHSQ